MNRETHIALLTMIVALILVSAVTAIELINPSNNSWTNYPPTEFSFNLENYSLNLTNGTLPSCELLLDSISTGAVLESENGTNGSNTTTYLFNHDLSGGLHNWSIECNLTNKTVISETRTIVLDQERPNITIHKPLSETYDMENMQIVFETFDNLDSEMSCTIQLVSSTYNNLQTVLVENNTNTTLNVTLDDGTYTSIIVCEDGVGNSEMQAVQFVIEIPEPFFDVNILQEDPEIGDVVEFRINATNNSDVTITIESPNGNTYVWDYQNQSFPKTETLPYTKRGGEYVLFGSMTFEGVTQSISQTFTIRNTLTAELDGDTTIIEGDNITLSAEVFGGINPTTITWKLHDNTEVTGEDLTFKYNTRGTYNVELNANDSEGNTYKEDITIIVYRLYGVLINILDSDTQNPLDDVFVEFADESNNTNLTGYAVFTVPEGTHELYIDYENYNDFRRDYEINENQTINVKLKSKEQVKPIITLKTEDKISFAESATLVFSVEDSGLLTCNLYINDQVDDWYALEQTIKDVEPTKDYEFAVDKPIGKYLWKVECVDEQDNGAFSKDSEFEINPEEEKQGEFDISAQGSSLEFQPIDSKQGEDVAQILELESKVSKANKEISWLQRDISNLQLDKSLTDEQIEIKKTELNKQIVELQQTTPIGLQVLSSTTVVTYPNDEDIKKALTVAVGEDVSSLLKQNIKLQNILTVTTDAYHVELVYEESTEIITLVKKTVVVSEDGPNFLVEIIPKEFAQTTDDLVILSDHQVLEKDPIIRFNVEDSIVYYTFGEKSWPVVQGAKTVIITRQASIGSSPTGFSIKGVAGSAYGMGFFVLIGIIIAGIVVSKTGVISKLSKKKSEPNLNTKSIVNQQGYGQQTYGQQIQSETQINQSGYQHSDNVNNSNTNSESIFSGFISNISKIFSKEKTSDPMIDMLIQQAFQAIGGKQLDIALAKYQQISNYYANLTLNLQQTYSQVITELCHNIDVNTAHTHLLNLKMSMQTGNVEGAMELFNHIQIIYANLPDNYKNEIAYDYNQVHSRIEELRSMIIHDLKRNDP